jgi:hypothetical protein
MLPDSPVCSVHETFMSFLEEIITSAFFFHIDLYWVLGKMSEERPASGNAAGIQSDHYSSLLLSLRYKQGLCHLRERRQNKRVQALLLHLPADLSIISPNKWQKSNNF